MDENETETTQAEQIAKTKQLQKELATLEKHPVDLGTPVQTHVNIPVLARMILSKIAKVRVYAPTRDEIKAWQKSASVAEVEAWNKRGQQILKVDHTEDLIAEVGILLPLYFKDPPKFQAALQKKLQTDYSWIAPRMGTILNELHRLCPIQYLAPE